MPERISTILKVSEKELDEKGVFNSFIDIDSSLYIDPCLLENLNIEEFKNSYNSFKTHFSKIILIIDKIKKPKDVYWIEAHKRLQFKEFRFTGLGYSVGGKKGNGIGKVLAEKMLNISMEIIEDGIKDPVIFELIGLIQDNISLDRISDMTTHIIKQDLINYTMRVSEELNITTRPIGRKKKYNLPFNPYNNDPIIFIPKKILRDIPIAFCWEDIDIVISETDSLKSEVNKIISTSWKDVMRRSKDYVRNFLFENKEAFKDLITQYKEKPRVEYNFLNDPLGEIIWAKLSENALVEYPIDFNKLKLNPVTSENILEVVRVICNQYSHLIENCGWYEYLYYEGKLRNERFAQKLFYGIADVHCRANDLNLSREPNAGNGALDFKITKGYKSVVTVELKYSTNSNLVKGYLVQLPTYNKAENSRNSIYLVLKTKDSDTGIKNLEREYDNLIKNGEYAPEIIVVDARAKLSASKREN